MDRLAVPVPQPCTQGLGLTFEGETAMLLTPRRQGNSEGSVQEPLHVADTVARGWTQCSVPAWRAGSILDM